MPVVYRVRKGVAVCHSVQPLCPPWRFRVSGDLLGALQVTPGRETQWLGLSPARRGRRDAPVSSKCRALLQRDGPGSRDWVRSGPISILLLISFNLDITNPALMAASDSPLVCSEINIRVVD